MPRLHPMGYLFLTAEIGTLAKSKTSSLKGLISAKTLLILKKYERISTETVIIHLKAKIWP